MVVRGGDARRHTEGMNALIEAHREQLLSLACRRGVTSVRVFGSMARGGERVDSDVDLLVMLAPGTSALVLGRLLLDAQELLGRRVDVVTEASLHPALHDRVLADAVPLRLRAPKPTACCSHTWASASGGSTSTPQAIGLASRFRGLSKTR